MKDKIQLNKSNIQKEILKIIMRKKRDEVIHTGSFALYYIKNKNYYYGESIKLKINDIDIDLSKRLIDKINNGIQLNIYDKWGFRKDIESYVSKVLLGNELYERYGITKYRVIVGRNNVKFRKNNKDTLGFSFEIKVYGTTDGDLSVFFDMNIEPKIFDIDKDTFIMDNEMFEVNTYSYNKILADKFIATTKHLDFVVSDLTQGEDLTLNNGNLTKLMKDLFDVNYIINLNKHESKKVLSYILMMSNDFDVKKINKTYKIIKMLIKTNPYIFEYRENTNKNDLNNLIKIIGQLFK